MFKNSVDKENIAVMYLRLSKEDGEKVESNSISNQREIINSYARKNQFTIVGEYVDDGYSGANFDRPNFKEMIKDSYDKKFDTIIVKDLSRFGRDYIEAGKFIQRIFPENGIRFISVNDNYDSKSADMNDTHLILPIKNFINDSYCRDISNKVKSSQKIKRERGDFISAFAPYGYKKSEENKNKLVVDEQAAPNIKNIFDMKLLGYSSKAIADELNHLGVLTPRKYKESQGFKCNGFQNIKGGNWSAKAVNRIIENEVYIGNTLQGKSITLNYKNKKQIGKDKEEWIRVEDTHEAIVSKEVFSIANTMLKRDLNNSRGKDKIDIFTGMLFCKECGSSLIRRTVKYKEREEVFYICSKYNKEKSCSRHSIKEEILIKAVSKIIKSYIEFNEKLYSKVRLIDINRNLKDKQIPILKREKAMTEELISSLYLDLKEDVISKEEYQLFRKNYMEKLTKLDESIQYRVKRQEDTKGKIDKNKSWIIDINRYKNLSEIDRLSVVMLIDKIYISEDKTIDVRFNHTEELSLLKEMTKTDKTKFKNDIIAKKSISTNGKSKAIPTIMNKSLVSAESEVCYG
ncbi:TPA: recombinase family protein [Streptococcus suis]|uniref:recombinase family protein n=1 Tax=Streptococcus suis TaxID=1307 RepID=UPI0005CDA848|nr:recombinase family protein [Streptococcus suis]NQR01192.1 recombinase family protein [Streptococcus suis]NQR72747.1 recombinase family protein [Streptococcus suis]NQS32887.1 recombinase family protein [Streptococcus suis]CYX25599.1 conjugative transposon site-specific recombinase [Streptococcus suis]HEM5621364.1 recombinase family protein [Streptococcus suis]